MNTALNIYALPYSAAADAWADELGREQVKADAIQTIGKDSCGTSAGGKMAACVRSTTGKSIYVISENQDPSYAASALDEVWKNI